jgi:hypothetical protein
MDGIRDCLIQEALTELFLDQGIEAVTSPVMTAEEWIQDQETLEDPMIEA